MDKFDTISNKGLTGVTRHRIDFFGNVVFQVQELMLGTKDRVIQAAIRKFRDAKWKDLMTLREMGYTPSTDARAILNLDPNSNLTGEVYHVKALLSSKIIMIVEERHCDFPYTSTRNKYACKKDLQASKVTGKIVCL